MAPVLPNTVHLDQCRSEAVILSDHISITEVRDSLRKLNNNRAPGLDGYPAEFLRYAVMTKPDGKREHVLLPALTAILNAALTQGYIPDSWNVNLITPIYKRGDASDPAN